MVDPCQYESLEGRVCVITGGAERVGRVIALRFAEQGADVVVNHLERSAQAEETAEAITSLGRRCLIVEADIGDPGSGTTIVDVVSRNFGRIDVLVHNAATSYRRSSGPSQLTPSTDRSGSSCGALPHPSRRQLHARPRLGQNLGHRWELALRDLAPPGGAQHSQDARWYG